MILTFPAMRGRMGKRDYFVSMVKLSLVPRMFKFREWAELPPEQRAQRVLQKSRIPEITQYILDNEEGYLFSALTASFDCEPKFTAVKGHEDLGFLEVPFDADLVINDGQHRRAAIEEALKRIRSSARKQFQLFSSRLKILVACSRCSPTLTAQPERHQNR